MDVNEIAKGLLKYRYEPRSNFENPQSYLEGIIEFLRGRQCGNMACRVLTQRSLAGFAPKFELDENDKGML